MNNDPLANMRDIHLADPVSQWPIAYGWWLSLLVLVIVTAIVFAIVRQQFKRRRIRRLLLNEVDQLSNQRNWPMHIMILLKRVAMTYLPACDIQGLTGSDWIHWMTKLMPKKDAANFQNDMELLIQSQYQPPKDELSLTHYQPWARQWIMLALKYNRKKQYASMLATVKTNSGEAKDV